MTAPFICIRPGASWPAGALTPQAPHSFVLDGVRCASMESLLQAMRWRSVPQQERVCAMPAATARSATIAAPDWRLTGILYWQGTCFRRGSHAHQRLMRRAWDALSSTPQFAGALEATGNAALDSPISDDPEQTLLTRTEFVEALMACRASIGRAQTLPLVLVIVQAALTLTLILSGAPLALLPLPATIFCAWMLWRRLRRIPASE